MLPLRDWEGDELILTASEEELLHILRKNTENEYDEESIHYRGILTELDQRRFT